MPTQKNLLFTKSTLLFFLILCWFPKFSFAQNASFSGQVLSGNTPLQGVSIIITSIRVGDFSKENGTFMIADLAAGVYFIKINLIGFITIYDSIQISENDSVVRNYNLQEDYLNLGGVVISGTRSQIEKYNTPVIVHTISNRIFDATQSLSVAEGLNFSPGLRIENNCQNCGFTQLRMNGLEGAYSQILMNSRPVFSALAGVYGLEMLPVNMVERIEVVRGGGSVLYGGNAIAGTVNIITKDPIQNTFEVGYNQSFTNFEAPDRTLSINGSLVNEKLDKGISFFGFNRARSPWDANNDGFSEMVKLKNTTFGFDAFWNTTKRSKLKFGLYNISEFRRGGNKFELVPHQTDLTEQLQHQILSAHSSFEWYSENYKHKFSTYASFQNVDRNSYYGGGGRILTDGDTLNIHDILAINAYGNSYDIAMIGGLQYNYEINKKMMLISGMEYLYNRVKDEMPGYARSINQNVGTLGTYAQLEITPNERLVFLLGGRFDHLNINGSYLLNQSTFLNEKKINILVPRLSAMYKIQNNLKLRTSFAQGYRGPQAFDEDLHIETVGGSARFILIDSQLKTERSNSGLVSLNFDKMVGEKQMNVVIEGFFTQLNNPFILSDQVELPNGVAVITKRNGTGAHVKGINLEANIAIGRKIIFQSGATFQNALYTTDEIIWSPEDENSEIPKTKTNRLLRTPNAYGYFTIVYNPLPLFSIAYSATLTGTMDVPHVIHPETEQTVIKSTPSFFDNNLKLSYQLKSKSDAKIQIFGGVQNIFNSFQKDFDLGAERDAGYIFGPMRPRTLFFGLKFGLT